MPDSFGKRKRRDVKAKKAASREERRLARNKRRRDREAGMIEPGPPVGPSEDAALGLIGPARPVPQADEQDEESADEVQEARDQA